MAQFDALTGLPNRVQFIERLADLIHLADEKTRYVALINIDLDRFKEVNDGYGHKVGDQLLQRLAARMIKHLADGEIVSRLSGDEFAAAKLFHTDEELYKFVQHIQHELTHTVNFDGFQVSVGASLGISIYPKDADSLDRLITNADLAMYRAKVSFEEKICFYESAIDEASRARRVMARDIFTGLKEKQFFVVYQVQKSIADSEVIGYEALLRWHHPELGLLLPSTFIPIAEECGAIIQLGDWVLETACREATTWNLQHKVAVNLSPIQLASSTIVERVDTILRETGLQPHRLEFEVTESAIISDKKHVLRVLRRFQSMGIDVAIDDFGVGYSSLEILRSFPFNKIKIDRSFTAELNTNRQAIAFIRAILALGVSLDIPVLAEGVETEEQALALAQEGCSEVQGFLYGYPETIDKLPS